MEMTKEEARDYIIRHCNPDYPKGKTEWETALNMAINALSADRDCISRQAAKLKVARVTWEDGDSCNDFHDKCVDCLDDLPSAQPEQRWTPVKSRPMDDEERKEWSEKLGHDLADDEAVIYSNLPDDGQECIVCTKWGNVFIDTFQNDPDYGCAFEDHGDMDGITAWMPLPRPWKEENR